MVKQLTQIPGIFAVPTDFTCDIFQRHFEVLVLLRNILCRFILVINFFSACVLHLFMKYVDILT